MADQRLIPNKSISPEETNAINNLIIPISNRLSSAKIDNKVDQNKTINQKKKKSLPRI